MAWVGHDASISVADATRDMATHKLKTQFLPLLSCIWISPSHLGKCTLDPNWTMDTVLKTVSTGPKFDSGYLTQIGQWRLNPFWAVDTGPKLGSGYSTQVGQWILDPFWAVKTGSILGSGYSTHFGQWILCQTQC